ncbi:MAG: monomethylamine:corrinoid methyltransferase [Candidatus Auribacterota bacterium]|nr:monomethylamine:corrinoid methyltransferase [Candidatus Auribacterota bacterium]
MPSMVKLMDMLQRAKDGPPMTMREWEIKVIPETVKKYLKKYDLVGTYNPEEPVNQDMELADRFFEAGLEMAAEIGLFMTDTDSIIHVSKEEIMEALRDAPETLTLGEGMDEVELQARFPEDPRPPVFAGPLSIQVDEELYVPIAEGILKSRKVRIQEGPSIDTVFGHPVYSGSPFETAAGARENLLRREAQWRAGRIGMANSGISSSTTEFGQLGGYANLTTPSNPAMCLILHPAELKLHYASFHKAVIGLACNGYIDAGSYSMIGGYTGGAEGATLGGIATDILQYPILQAHASACSIYDIRYDSTCNRHSLWGLSMILQAIGRNAPIIMSKIINQTAGPCTEEILYTSAAGLIAGGVSGMSWTIGCRSAGGRFKNYITPLEHWFCGEVFEASAKLSLSQANELVLYLLTKYEDGLKDQPKGKSFTECFDVKTLTPTKEWQDIYDRVKEDLVAHGMSFD